MSIDLYGLPNGIWFKGKFINEGDGLYLGTSDEFFRGGLDGISRCLKAGGQDAGVCVRYETKINGMKERSFHRHCRVVYRAMRKQYGIEKVQDECLRVFKVIYPLYYKAKKDEGFGFDEKSKERIRKIFESWNPKPDSELDLLLGTILNRMDGDFTKESFVEFCDDVMVIVMRIRKLSPREAGRLMGCDEKTLDTMLSCGISKSAAYKCFGNSIVVDVLFHIFRKLFIESDPDMVKGEVYQLSLF